jgi:hypothetical protein
MAKSWAIKQGEGTQFLRDMGLNGGTIAGMNVAVTDGVDAGTFVVVDASQIAAGSDTVELDVTRQATLQLETTPDSPPTASTVLQSLWQTNSVALKAERFFGAEPLTDTAVALIDGVSSI